VLSQLQEHLEAIYGLNHAERVQQFLVDEKVARELGATGRAPEELLVHEAGQELWLGLYFSPELHQRLETLGTSVETWLEGHLNAYCQLAEGVSHFLYLTYAAFSARAGNAGGGGQVHDLPAPGLGGSGAVGQRDSPPALFEGVLPSVAF